MEGVWCFMYYGRRCRRTCPSTFLDRETILTSERNEAKIAKHKFCFGFRQIVGLTTLLWPKRLNCGSLGKGVSSRQTPGIRRVFDLPPGVWEGREIVEIGCRKVY